MSYLPRHLADDSDARFGPRPTSGYIGLHRRRETPVTPVSPGAAPAVTLSDSVANIDNTQELITV